MKVLHDSNKSESDIMTLPKLYCHSIAVRNLFPGNNQSLHSNTYFHNLGTLLFCILGFENRKRRSAAKGGAKVSNTVDIQLNVNVA